MAKKTPNMTALRRGTARLAAVQASYQMDMTSSSIDQVVRDFLSGAVGGEVIEEDLDMETETSVPLIELNAELFTILVRGVQSMKVRLDEVINASLGKGWDAGRLEPILRSILRCGLYELMERPDMPPRAAVSEYVDIARAFYDGSEPGMVNAVLDRLARELRPEEMEAAAARRASRAADSTGGTGEGA